MNKVEIKIILTRHAYQRIFDKLGMSFEEFRDALKGRDAVVSKCKNYYYIIVHPYLLPCVRKSENKFLCLTINFNIYSDLEKKLNGKSFDARITDVFAKRKWRDEFCHSIAKRRTSLQLSK